MRTVIGVFADESYAQEAMGELENRGFSPEDISIIMKDSRVDAGTATTRDFSSGLAKGATSGVATGAVLGGLAGLLVGIGALALPGIGAFLVGGPLAAALGLTGAAATTVTGVATGAVAGGLIGALTGLGLSHEQAVAYEEQIKEGAILMAIPTASEFESDIRAVLDRFNATDVTSIVVPSDRFRSTDKTALSDADYADARDDEREIDDRTSEYAPSSYRSAGVKGGRSTMQTSRRVSGNKLHTRRRRLM